MSADELVAYRRLGSVADLTKVLELVEGVVAENKQLKEELDKSWDRKIEIDATSEIEGVLLGLYADPWKVTNISGPSTSMPISYGELSFSFTEASSTKEKLLRQLAIEHPEKAEQFNQEADSLLRDQHLVAMIPPGAEEEARKFWEEHLPRWGTICSHVAVDTGMKISWCRYCDKDMVFTDKGYVLKS